MAATVSLLLPVLDEEAHIRACIESLRAQDHPGIVEILVAEGGSTDATRSILDELASADPPVIVVDNPQRNQAPGLNLLIERARGEICVRVDAHSTYASDYVRRCVAALDTTGAAMVGGPMIPVGATPIEAAIAAAMSSPVGVGTASYRRPDAAGPVDTVYLGAYRTATIRQAGGYRRFPSGVAEDTDLAYRLRRAGGTVLLDPSISSSYRPRGSYRALWRQFWRYGRAKAEMLYANGRFPSWRPFAPLLLVVGLLAGAVLGGVTGAWWPVSALGGLWLIGAAAGSLAGGHPLRTTWAIVIMHLAFGLGLGRGLLAGRGFVAGLTTMRGAGPASDPSADDLDR